VVIGGLPETLCLASPGVAGASSPAAFSLFDWAFFSLPVFSDLFVVGGFWLFQFQSGGPGWPAVSVNAGQRFTGNYVAGNFSGRRILAGSFGQICFRSESADLYSGCASFLDLPRVSFSLIWAV